MIIRSQNKKELHNLDTIKMIKIVTNSQDYFVEVNSQHTIGTYSTEEKAIKVLDEICAFANGIHFENIATDQCGRLDGIVFQMPQDSEV